MAETNLYTTASDTGAGAEILRFPSNLRREGYPFVLFAPYQRDRVVSQGSGTESVLSTLATPSRAIALPLPSSALETKYGVNYKDASLGAAVGSMVVGGKETLKSLGMSSATAAGTQGAQILASIGSTLASQAALGVRGALGALGGFGEQLADAATLATGLQVNPFTEVMFESVPFRTHTFSYTFHPRSEAESVMLDRIIQYFKYYMLPQMTSAAGTVMGTFLKFPLEWQIMYSIADTTFTVLPSVLTDMDVKFADGVDTPKLFTPVVGSDSRYPAKVSLTLNFKETVMMTRNYVQVNNRLDGEALYTDLPTPQAAAGDANLRTRYRF